VRAPLPSFVEPDDAAAPEWSRLRLLPELGDIKKQDVMAWLKAEDTRNVLRLTDRDQIAGRVTADGTPRAVFDRLNNEGVWRRLTR
jgi:hypothetical protein